jgi:phosphoglycerol transferase MdoB-like AlkP superfamily enzyme
MHSRRLRYAFGVAGVLFVLFAALRALFYFGFSGFEARALIAMAPVVTTLGIGLRFDLRLALLIMLPVALLAAFPVFNLVRRPGLRWIARAYLVIAVAAVLLVYIIDFGHFAYLGERVNATVLRFVDDARISTDMVLQSYPVGWIVAGWLATTALVGTALILLERVTLERPARRIGRGAMATGAVVSVIALFFGLLGRVDNLNLENPVHLRWNDAYFSGDNQIAALGLNPVIFLYDTLKVPEQPYDREQVRAHYDTLARYLGVERPNLETLEFGREQPVQPYALRARRAPNVILVMLESMGSSAMGAFGNPLDPTPNLDRIAREGWFFRNFYVPSAGTAKSVWGSLTGVPDVSRQESASRNPLIVRQHSLVNALTGYDRYYMIGGNSGWANMNALIRQSIDGIRLYEEGQWQSPTIDVWGISDCDLFRESDRILRAQPRDRPFFAYIQTAGNHRPYTIPKDNDGFVVSALSAAEVDRGGFVSTAQFNGVRLLDHAIGRLMAIARAGGYFDDTVFVLFGDHNARVTRIPHMPPAFEKLGLEANHVPLILYAPGLLEPRVFDEAVGLSDVLPTMLGLLGTPFRSGALGRDVQQAAPEGERTVPVVLRQGTFPVIAGVTRNFVLQMAHDGRDPTLHDLNGQDPLENVADRHPEVFRRLVPLTRGLHEAARLMLYQNVRRD